MDEFKKDHRFKKVWNEKKKEKPNSERIYPTLSFRTNNLDPEIIDYLKDLQEKGSMSEFVCQAVSTKHFMKFHPRQFLFNIVEAYHDQIKFLIRKVGRENAKIKSKENNRNIYKH